MRKANMKTHHFVLIGLSLLWSAANAATMTAHFAGHVGRTGGFLPKGTALQGSFTYDSDAKAEAFNTNIGKEQRYALTSFEIDFGEQGRIRTENPRYVVIQYDAESDVRSAYVSGSGYWHNNEFNGDGEVRLYLASDRPGLSWSLPRTAEDYAFATLPLGGYIATDPLGWGESGGGFRVTSLQVVPEPSAWAMFALGLVAMATVRKRA